MLHVPRVQVAVIVYLIDLTNMVGALEARGLPDRLAILISFVVSVVVLDYLTMPVCSLLFDTWLSQPRRSVSALCVVVPLCVPVSMSQIGGLRSRCGCECG